MTTVDPDTLEVDPRCCATSSGDLAASWRSTPTSYARAPVRIGDPVRLVLDARRRGEVLARM